MEKTRVQIEEKEQRCLMEERLEKRKNPDEETNKSVLRGGVKTKEVQTGGIYQGVQTTRKERRESKRQENNSDREKSKCVQMPRNTGLGKGKK